MRKSKEAALTYTRASLGETLAQVEEFTRMYGSLQTVADRIVELEAEVQERDEQLAAATRERDALRAQLMAERGKGLSPEAVVQILRRRVYCVGDFGRLLPVLREGQSDQSGDMTVDTGEGGQQATPPATVLMMTVQELTPAAAPALAPLFAASSPPPSPTVAVATAPLPPPARPITMVSVKAASAAPMKEKKSPGRKKRVNAQPQDNAKKVEDAKSEMGVGGKQQENSDEEAHDDTKEHEKEEEEEEEEGEGEEEEEASDGEMASRTRSAGPTKRRRGVPLWTKRKRSASATKQPPTPPLRRGPPGRRGRPPSRVKTDVQQDEPHPIKQLRETRDVTPRHILQWPQPPVDFDGQSDGPHNKGEGAHPAFQTLDFRVVASLEQTKPWDSMCSHRTRWLRVPDLASPAVVEWATRCLKSQYARRQAYWERLHWLPDSCCKGVQWEKYKVARQERATLADREWRSIYADSVRLMAENLLAEDVWCDPALWLLPEHPVLLLPKSVDLHAQIRLADSNEPIRLYFVNAPTQHPFFAEGLATTYPTKQLAPHVGGEDPDVEDSSEGEAEWNLATKRKRAVPKRMNAKENGGLMQANGAQDEEDEPEAE